ncbi:MAG: hypothetical protein DRO11_07300 [Methanobacteriota archaeon]|nr:MAG: hypothetical protein DRO11_07300 [Euryarchaeota archaeon]
MSAGPGNISTEGMAVDDKEVEQLRRENEELRKALLRRGKLEEELISRAREIIAATAELAKRWKRIAERYEEIIELMSKDREDLLNICETLKKAYTELKNEKYGEKSRFVGAEYV